jgi:pyrophosphatase PpaX
VSAARETRGVAAFTAVLFDLDGTLVDSIELIFRSYEHAFRAHGLPAVPRERILLHLGRTLPDSFTEFTGDPLRALELVATYRAFNLAHHDQLVKPYAGANDALRALRDGGRRVGIVTSKKRETAQRGLAVCGIDARFDVFVAMEDCRLHKPHPEPLLRALDALALAPIEVCYVGDSPHDVAAGNAAGTPVFVAEWGPFERAHFAGLDVTGWLAEPRDLVAPRGAQAVRE